MFRETLIEEVGRVPGTRRCIVCGRSEPFTRLYARDGFTLVRCPGCGLVFQHPQPTEAELQRTYYHDSEWTRAQLVEPMRTKLMERAKAQVEMLERAGIRAHGQRLLDVGCAAGTFMTFAQQAGWHTTGVELGAATAEAARSRGLDVRTGTLRDAFGELEPGSFELVTFWDVLEHVRDPRQELALARALLHPGGMIAATMPNVSGLYPQATYRLIARHTGRWEYPELPVHLHDFDPRTITQLLSDAGYRDVGVRTFATPFWYYRATSLARGALGGRVRGRAVRGAFELLHVVLYPVARLTDRQNSQFVLATSVDGAGQAVTEPLGSATSG
jgi:2-polyprenyl-3-methyl-5-hydroxy-6-metoxy-1,4-benzoquinol methylase